MKDYTYIPLKEAGAMKSYVFKVVFEKDKWPDEPEEKAIWRAYIPALPSAHAETAKDRGDPLKQWAWRRTLGA